MARTKKGLKADGGKDDGKEKEPFDINYFYHWLAAHYGYQREYVDKYITLPYFRAIKKYNKEYPPLSILLMGIGKSLGIKYNNNTVEESDKKVTAENLMNLEGVSVNSVEKEKFLRDLSIIDSPSNY